MQLARGQAVPTSICYVRLLTCKAAITKVRPSTFWRGRS